jgi:hypothetical protein
MKRYFWVLIMTALISLSASGSVWAANWNSPSAQTVKFSLPAIENIKVPDNWSLVKNYEAYRQVIENSYQHFGKSLPGRHKLKFTSDGDKECLNHLKFFDEYRQEEPGMWQFGKTLDWDFCFGLMVMRNFKANPFGRSGKGDTTLLKNILLHYASNDLFKMAKNDKYGHYAFWKGLSMMAASYSIERAHMGLSREEQKAIDNWFKDRAKVNITDHRRNIKCVMWSPSTSNDCGSVRFAHTLTRLLIGLTIQDQVIFDLGIGDLKYLLSFVGEDGVHYGMGQRGGLAISYSVQVPYYFSVYAEIFDTLGKNFYEIELPSGVKISDVFDFHYTILGDDVPKALIKYARLDHGNKGYSHTELFKPINERKGQHNPSNPGDLGVYLPGRLETMIRNSIRYVEQYRVDLLPFFEEELNEPTNLFGGNHPLVVHAIVRANQPSLKRENDKKTKSDHASPILREKIEYQNVTLKLIAKKEQFLAFKVKLWEPRFSNEPSIVSEFKVLVDTKDPLGQMPAKVLNLRISLDAERLYNPVGFKNLPKCSKQTVKVSGSTIEQYRLYSANLKKENECALSTMTEAGRKEAESLLATLGQIFANDNVKKSDPYGVLEKHSQFLMGAAGN